MEPPKAFYIKYIHSSIQYRITSKCNLVLMVATTGYTAERGKASSGRKTPGSIDDSPGPNSCWSFTAAPGFKGSIFLSRKAQKTRGTRVLVVTKIKP